MTQIKVTIHRNALKAASRFSAVKDTRYCLTTRAVSAFTRGPDMLRSAEFTDIQEAAKYRQQHGGWLFVIGETNAWWFDAACYTASSVITSRQIKGYNGELVCDNRYLESTDGTIQSDMCKNDAIILAHNMAHKNQEPAYAVETKWGWTCASRKPSLRFGKVIECNNGKESLA